MGEWWLLDADDPVQIIPMMLKISILNLKIEMIPKVIYWGLRMYDPMM